MSARTFCTTFDVPVLLFVRADFIQPIPVTAVTPFTPANPLDPRQPLLPRHHRSPSPKTPQHVHESPQECPENTPLISEDPKTTPEHPQIIPEHPQITLKRTLQGSLRKTQFSFGNMSFPLDGGF